MSDSHLIVGIGSVGESIALRMLALTRAFGGEAIDFVAICAPRDDEDDALRPGTAHGMDSIRIPLQPLVGEGFAWGDGGDLPRRRPTDDAADLLSLPSVSMTGIVGTPLDSVRRSFAVAGRVGRLRTLEEHVDALLLDGCASQGPGRMRVTLVGALGDCVCAGIAADVAKFVSAYVERRYHGVRVCIECWLLGQEVLYDRIHHADLRQRLDEHADATLRALGAHDLAHDNANANASINATATGHALSGARLFSSVVVLPVVNADGRRLASVEDYCTELAAMLLVDCTRSHEGPVRGADEEPGCVGVGLLRFPGEALRRAVARKLSREAIEWWGDIDDLWGARGWSDYGGIGASLDAFYRREVRRRAVEDESPAYVEIVERLDDLAKRLSDGLDDECADGASLVARSLLGGVDVAARRWATSFLDGGARGFGVDLSCETQDGAVSKGDGATLAYEGASVRRRAERLVAALDFLEAHLTEVARDAARTVFAPDPESGGDASAAWRLAVRDEASGALHPMALRCVLYACRDLVKAGAADTDGPSPDGAAPGSAMGAAMDGDSHPSRLRALLGEAIESLDEAGIRSGDGVGEPLGRRSVKAGARSRIGSAAKTLLSVRASIGRWVEAEALACFQDEARERVDALIATYEDFFETIRVLSRDLADEQADVLATLSGRGARGRVCRDLCADPVSFQRLADVSAGHHLAPSPSWGRLLVSLAAYDSETPLSLRNLEAARRRAAYMLSVARACIVDEWERCLRRTPREAGSPFDMGVWEAAALEHAALGETAGPTAVIEEVRRAAVPFGVPDGDALKTDDRIVLAGTDAACRLEPGNVDVDGEPMGRRSDMALVYRTCAGRLSRLAREQR